MVADHDVATLANRKREALRRSHAIILAATASRVCQGVGVAGCGTAPWLGWWFQTVPEPKVVRNRVHLDLAALDLEAEVERLLGLGATRFEPPSRDDELGVLCDPEGNEFSVIQA